MSHGNEEPDAGTDVLGLKTSAAKMRMVIGSKRKEDVITNGVVDDNGDPADVVIVYARTGEKENGRPEISTFLVEKDFLDTRWSKIIDKTGIHSSNTAELVFDHCIIPSSNLIGEVGESDYMMKNLEIERLTLAAMSLGIARGQLKK